MVREDTVVRNGTAMQVNTDLRYPTRVQDKRKEGLVGLVEAGFHEDPMK